MPRRATLLVVCLAASACTARSPAARGPSVLVFQHVRLFDGTTVQSDVTVTVREGVVVAVGRGAPIPRDARVVDGARRTLLPGLVDAHVHVWEAAQLEQAIVFGVTTELDMMTLPSVAKDLERRASGASNLADLYSAGNPVTAPHGHGTEYGLAFDTLDGPAGAADFVDRRLREGSDYLKVMFTPGSPRYPSIDRETLEACVKQAHRRGLRVVAHVESLRGATEAIAAGVDGLAHLFADAMPPPSFGASVAARGAFVVPTLTALLRDGAADDVAARREVLVATLGQLVTAHAPILAGTDAPNPGTTHGASLHRELEWLVALGMSPIDALTAATSAPARAFGLRDRGRVVPGLRADLVLVDGDPTTDIRRTRAIVGVWKRGVAVDREGFAERARQARATAEAPATVRAALGVVADFEQDEIRSRFGRFTTSTDEKAGGASSVAMALARGGAHGSGGSLFVTGEVVGGPAITWAGVYFSPGSRPEEPADLSGGTTLSFWARGNPGACSVLVFTAGKRAPAVATFQATADWTRFSFPLAAFAGADPTRAVGVFVGATQGGRFTLSLDDFALE